MISFTPNNIRLWSRLGPSGAFGAAAIDLGEDLPEYMVLTADVCSFSGLDRFANLYPNKFLNVGIAEQNMIGIAAGLSNEGYNVMATTYAAFISLRVADQVKLAMGYMKKGMKLIGFSAGLSAGILGPTHMSIEDIAVMRAIPGITILSPADCTEAVKCVLAAGHLETPVYIRMSGEMGSPVIYKSDYDYVIGKAIPLRSGSDVLCLSTGAVTIEALKASEILEQYGISMTVLDVHTIKPLDVDSILDNISGKKLIVTVEEHNVFGGLGSAVAEVLAGEGAGVPLDIIGVNDWYPSAGEYRYLREESGLSAEKIAMRIKRRL